MKALLRAVYRRLPQTVQRSLKAVFKGYASDRTEPLMYRIALFEELLGLSPKDHFHGGRILEIGPRDGLDSRRLSSLTPQDLVLIDLPEKCAGNEKWLVEITCPSKYIESNIMYMPNQDWEALGKFRLIWCTGVLYHNAEQMRMLRKLYRLLEIGGYLVLESATLRSARSLRDGAFVEIHYPQTYRDTGSVTHLPSASAIKAWLAMVGFREIHESNCYKAYNRDLMGERFACVCRKNAEDESEAYYQKSGLNPKYRFGDSV